MMRNRLHLILPILIVGFLLRSCSPVEVVQGTEKMGYLEGEKQIAFKITYNDTKVGEQKEEKFIEEKVKEKNDGEKGAGDEWAKKWRNNKEEVYFSTFRSQLQDYLEEVDPRMSLIHEKEKANYIIRVNIDRIETGFYGGVVYGDAILDSRMFIKKVGNSEPEHVLKLEDVESGEAITTKDRLSNCYQSTAMHYGRFIRGKLQE